MQKYISSVLCKQNRVSYKIKRFSIPILTIRNLLKKDKYAPFFIEYTTVNMYQNFKLSLFQYKNTFIVW